MQPALCLPLPASTEVRPHAMAGDVSITRPRDPPTAAPSISEGLYRNSNLTPGITRPPKPLVKHEKQRVAGRVHAVVSWRAISLAGSRYQLRFQDIEADSFRREVKVRNYAIPNFIKHSLRFKLRSSPSVSAVTTSNFRSVSHSA